MIKSFDLEQISRYCSALMGFAIIWVVIYHFGIHMPVLS